MSTTPLMSLVLPVPSVTLGPEWATTLNTALELIDSHDHSSGKGTKVTPAGLNINTDLELNSFNLVEVKSMRMDSQASTLIGVNDVRCLYVVGIDLYYNDANGNAIRITNAGALDISTTGGFTGDYATSTADASYSAVSKTFSFDQIAGIRAKIDASDVLIREAVASANAVTLKSPVSLASSYAWVFPAALPSSTSKFLQVTTTGTLESNIDVDNSGIEIASNLIQIKNLGVTTAKINDLAVTTIKINDEAVTTAKIQDLAITTGKLNTSAVTGVKISSDAVSTDKRVGLYTNEPLSSGAVALAAGVNNLTASVAVSTTTLAAHKGFVVHVFGYVTYTGGTSAAFGGTDAFEIYSDSQATVIASRDVGAAGSAFSGMTFYPNVEVAISFPIKVSSIISGSSDTIKLRFNNSSLSNVTMKFGALVIGI